MIRLLYVSSVYSQLLILVIGFVFGEVCGRSVHCGLAVSVVITTFNELLEYLLESAVPVVLLSSCSAAIFSLYSLTYIYIYIYMTSSLHISSSISHKSYSM